MNIAGGTNVRLVRYCCIALLCGFGAGGAPAHAATYDGGVGYSMSYDSNITRSTVPTADVTEQLFGGFAIEERSPELAARALVQVERRRFVRHTYEDDNGFFLDGSAVWTISPRFFTWAFDDLFRELPINLTLPGTPANWAKTNSFSTGPEFTFRLGPANVPVIGARYGAFRVQQTVATSGIGNSERFTLYARWLRLASASTTLSLNYEATRAKFDPPQPPAFYSDLTREDLFFRYEYLLPDNRSRHTLDVGTMRALQYGGTGLNVGQDLSGRVVRYAGLWSPTPESAFGVTLSDQISDTYSDMIRSVTGVTITGMPMLQADAAVLPYTAATVTTDDLYHSRGGELTYVNRGARLGYSLAGYVRRVDFQTVDTQDYQEKGGRLTLSWFFSAEAQAYAFTRYLKRNFPNLDETDADRDKGLGISYRMGRSLTLTVEVGEVERQSNVPLTAFVDRRAMLLLGYSTGPVYSPRSRR